MFPMDDLDTRWRQLSEEVMTGMKEWRMPHPQVTLQEIEAALDERLGRLRARMLEDAALASRAADWSGADEQERPPCPQCGTPMEARGRQSRELVTHHNQTIHLKRSYAVCPKGKRGLFPLDEERQLLPGRLTPSLEESLVRLATWMPCAKAVKELHHFTRVTVSEPTVRRDTQVAGAAYVAIQTEEVERIERTVPPAPEGPPLQFLSVDGAMVPLVHKEGAEVKTLAIGAVQPPVMEKGEFGVHTPDLSYCSRLADAETCGRLALVETHRRGTETAHQVWAVTDGADWDRAFSICIGRMRGAFGIFPMRLSTWRKPARPSWARGRAPSTIGCKRRCMNSSMVNRIWCSTRCETCTRKCVPVGPSRKRRRPRSRRT